jgi:molybdate transport system substrate-binding protein
MVSRSAEIRIAAASSLAEALEETANTYSKHSTNSVKISLGASVMLARQIRAGARMDIFLSADERSMNLLSEEKLITEGTRRDFLTNTLILAAPTDPTVVIKQLSDVGSPQVKRIAIGDPELVPAGLYAKHVLQEAKLWAAIQKKVVPCENVRAVLAALESGNVEAGILYQTDLLHQNKCQAVCSLMLPAGEHISYPIALLKGSGASARDFWSFLLSTEGKAIFTRHGFGLME